MRSPPYELDKDKKGIRTVQEGYTERVYRLSNWVGGYYGLLSCTYGTPCTYCYSPYSPLFYIPCVCEPLPRNP